jgi:ribonuclease HI
MATKYNKLIIYTDGGARGNPGPAGIGAVIKDENGETVATISEFIGEATNNQAEYKAVIAALKRAKSFKAQELEVFLDSELVCEQLNQKYKIKNQELAPLFVQIWNLSIGMKKTIYKHIPREKNQEADKLVNLAIDKALKG